MDLSTFVNQLAVKLNAIRFEDPHSPLYTLYLKKTKVNLQPIHDSQPRKILVSVPLLSQPKDSPSPNLPPLSDSKYKPFFTFLEDPENPSNFIVSYTVKVDLTLYKVKACIKWLLKETQQILAQTSL